jgi:DNA-binding NtrC family response regulator
MSKPTLLFVDDEERILRSLTPMFRADYRVLSTTDPSQALAWLRDDKVHVIVSDQRMPTMLGAELLRQAREISPATMRLLLTGYSDLEAAMAAVNDGEIYRYVSKPWNMQELRQTVGQAAQIGLRLAEAYQYVTTTPAAQPINILVIEGDDAGAGNTIRDIVGQGCDMECKLHWAHNLEQAMELLMQKDIGVVITDLHINDQDASATVKALKRYRPHVVTVVVTRFRDNNTLIDLINQGQIYRFLPKPISRGLLSRSVQSAMQHHRLLRDSPQIAARHAVEPVAETPQRRLPAQLSGFINRLRGGLSQANG